MPKFQVTVTEHIERGVEFEANITKAEVVKAKELEGEDAENWKDFVQDYIDENWDELHDKGKLIEGDEQSRDITSRTVDSCEED